MHSLLLPLFLLAYLTAFTPSQAQSTSISDCAVLETLYRQANNPAPWANSGAQSCCGFTSAIGDVSINCTATGRVVAVSLQWQIPNPSHLGIAGPIPAAFSGFTELRNFTILGSPLANTQLPDLSALVNLETLEVYGGGLTGAFPNITGMAGLKKLVLRGNALTGTLPPLSGNPQLQVLDVGSNKLSGPIPQNLSLLTKLTNLTLGWNGFSGPLPNLTSCANLVSVNLAYSGLSGNIDGLIPAATGPALERGRQVAECVMAGTGLYSCEGRYYRCADVQRCCGATCPVQPGTVAGAVVGCVGAIVLAGLGVVWWRRRRSRKAAQSEGVEGLVHH